MVEGEILRLTSFFFRRQKYDLKIAVTFHLLSENISNPSNKKQHYYRKNENVDCEESFIFEPENNIVDQFAKNFVFLSCYTAFSGKVAKKRTRQSRKVVWDIVNALLISV